MSQTTAGNIVANAARSAITAPPPPPPPPPKAPFALRPTRQAPPPPAGLMNELKKKLAQRQARRQGN